MYRKLLTLTATAAVAATALAPAAGAAAAAPAPTLKVEGAYLYLDHEPASHQQFVRLVFRTATPLPRRYDGMIRAGASIEGAGHSVATARKGTTIYTVASEVKGGSIATTSSGS